MEADLDWSGMKGDVTCPGGTCTTKNDWLGTARARLGYGGWNNWLPYITGGAAFGDIKAENPAGTSASKDQGRLDRGPRPRIRAALELSVKLEYLYADLGSFDCGATCGATPDDVTFKTNIVRAASTTASKLASQHCRPNDETPGGEPGVFLYATSIEGSVQSVRLS